MPTVKCTMPHTAIGHDDDWMRQDVMIDRLGVWHIGLGITCITDGILALRFRRFVNEDFVHEQHRLPRQADTVVQISCLLKLPDDDPVQVDTVAVVVPVDVTPMRRSGISFGQKGLIDSVGCGFVPAVVPAAEVSGRRRMGGGASRSRRTLGLMGRCIVVGSEVMASRWYEVFTCFLFMLHEYGFLDAELQIQGSEILA